MPFSAILELWAPGRVFGGLEHMLWADGVSMFRGFRFVSSFLHAMGGETHITSLNGRSPQGLVPQWLGDDFGAPIADVWKHPGFARMSGRRCFKLPLPDPRICGCPCGFRARKGAHWLNCHETKPNQSRGFQPIRDLKRPGGISTSTKNRC